MNATVPLGEFRLAIQRAERVTGKHASLPLLEGIFIDVRGGMCTIRATNLSIGFEESIPARVTGEGSVVVHADKLIASVYGGQDDASVELKLENENLLVTLPSGQFLVRAIPSEGFPALPEVLDGRSIEMPARDFLQGISRVLFAASVSEVKPELASISFRADDHLISFVATDAFRLAENLIKTAGVVSFAPILIPARSAGLFSKLITDSGDITITSSETQMTIRGAKHLVSLKLTPGSFPDYKRIIPAATNTTVTVLRSDLVNALRSLAAFTDRDFRIDLVADPETKSCVLSSNVHDAGSGEYRLDAVLEGGRTEVRLNQKSLSDALVVIDSDTVVLKMLEANKPIVVVGQGDTGFLYLMMPMNR
jgi:DNA polymerase III subunit beta